MAVEYGGPTVATPAAPSAPPSYAAPAAPVTGFTPVAPVSPSIVPATPVGQPAAPAPTPTPQDQIRDLATQYGLPADQFSGFTDVDNAKAAARLYLDSVASRGYQGGGYLAEAPAPVQPAAAPVQPAAAPAAIELDLDTTDPKVVAAFKAQQAQIAQLIQRTEAAENSQRAAQETQQREIQQQIWTRASNTIDKLASATYGVAGNRSVVQRAATEQLLRVADSLIAGYRAQGGNVPTIETILQQAVFLHSGGAQTAAAPAPVVNAPSLVPQGYGYNGPTRPATNPFVAPAVPGQPRVVPLDQDPDFAAAAIARLRQG